MTAVRVHTLPPEDRATVARVKLRLAEPPAPDVVETKPARAPRPRRTPTPRQTCPWCGHRFRGYAPACDNCLDLETAHQELAP